MKQLPERFSLEVPAEAAGQRIDRFLASRLDHLSRSRIQSLIQSGNLRGRTGTLGDAAAKVKCGDVLVLDVPAATEASLEPQPLDLAILFEDEHIIVIDKPPGLVVHPSPGHADGTLVNALIAHCGPSLKGIGGVRRPGIVHRLDKDTSGLLVVAKSDAAHDGLTRQFAAHGADGRLERAYVALAWGGFAHRRGVIDAWLGRSVRSRTKIVVVRETEGRHAVTRFEVLREYPDRVGKTAVSEVRLVLETGRTHQIRVHLAHIGHPVLGDPTYGRGFSASARRLDEEAQEALAALGRQALHAALLALEHPVTGQRLRFESPLPPDMARLKRALASGH